LLIYIFQDKDGNVITFDSWKRPVKSTLQAVSETKNAKTLAPSKYLNEKSRPYVQHLLWSTERKELLQATSPHDEGIKERLSDPNGAVPTLPATSMKRIVIAKDALLRYVFISLH
jgi:hypothetical protein